MDIQQPFVTQEQKFKFWTEAKDEIKILRERVKELEEANKLLEADARRYRWLSAQNAELELDSFVVLSHDSTVEEDWQKYWVGSDLNKAINEAMENNNDNS